MQEKILQTAFQLFHRNGIKSVSMDDISRQMGISKKTLYKWFENKDEVVKGVMQAHLNVVETDCGCIVDRSKNAIHELFLMMDMLREVFANIHPSIFYDLQKYHPETWALWQQHKNGFILNKIMGNIERGISEKLYRADLNVELMARIRLVELDVTFNPEYFPPSKFSLQKVQIAMLEHFMLGIATLKGHKLINSYKHITEEE